MRMQIFPVVLPNGKVWQKQCLQFFLSFVPICWLQKLILIFSFISYCTKSHKFQPKHHLKILQTQKKYVKYSTSSSSVPKLDHINRATLNK